MLKPTRLWIFLRKVWYWIWESWILWWKGKSVFWHGNDNHDFLFYKNHYCTLYYLQVCWWTVTNLYVTMGNLYTKHSYTHSFYVTIIQPRNLKLEYHKIVEFMEEMNEWQRWKSRTECAFNGSLYERVLTDAIYDHHNTHTSWVVYSNMAVETTGGTAHHLIKQH